MDPPASQIAAQVRADLESQMDAEISRLGRDATDTVRANWPIDTGRSHRGLGFRVDGAWPKWRVVLTNRQDYAVWVVRRWYQQAHTRARRAAAQWAARIGR